MTKLRRKCRGRMLCDPPSKASLRRNRFEIKNNKTELYGYNFHFDINDNSAYNIHADHRKGVGRRGDESGNRNVSFCTQF